MMRVKRATYAARSKLGLKKNKSLNSYKKTSKKRQKNR